MAHLINTRWINIPIEEIYQQLWTLGIDNWENRIIHIAEQPRHYLFGEGYAYPYSLPPDVVDALADRLNEAIYMTWYREYNKQAMDHFEEYGEALNQAQAYWADVGDVGLPEPEIMPINGLQDGDEYIAIIGLFHLTGSENGNNHHLYIDLIDENGDRIYDHYPPLSLYYGWEGMSAEEENATSPVRIDKLPNEPGANIGMSWNQIIYGFHVNNMAVDRFRGVHTRYEDDGDGNNRGHHSHYIVLQKRIYQTGPEPPGPGPEPEPEPEPELETAAILISKEWFDSLPPDDDGYVRIFDRETLI